MKNLGWHTLMENRYRRRLELSLLGTLFVCNAAVFTFRPDQRQEAVPSAPPRQPDPPRIQLEDIKVTAEDRAEANHDSRPEPETKPAEPAEPEPVAEARSAEIEPDTTRADTVVREEVNPSGDSEPFVAVQQPPFPVGGLSALREKLHYPEHARRLRLEGQVIVNVFVDENGRVTRTEILSSPGFEALERAAIAAIQAVEWVPAQQRNQPVAVWVAVPVVFRLHR